MVADSVREMTWFALNLTISMTARPDALIRACSLVKLHDELTGLDSDQPHFMDI